MTGEETAHLFEGPYPDSELLANLPHLLEFYPSLQNLAGPLAQFTLMIDANIASSSTARSWRESIASPSA